MPDTAVPRKPSSAPNPGNRIKAAGSRRAGAAATAFYAGGSLLRDGLHRMVADVHRPGIVVDVPGVDSPILTMTPSLATARVGRRIVRRQVAGRNVPIHGPVHKDRVRAGFLRRGRLRAHGVVEQRAAGYGASHGQRADSGRGGPLGSLTFVNFIDVPPCCQGRLPPSGWVRDSGDVVPAGNLGLWGCSPAT